MVYKLKPKLPLSDLAEWRNGSASDSSMWNATLPQWSLQKVIRSNRVSVILFYFMISPFRPPRPQHISIVLSFKVSV